MVTSCIYNKTPKILDAFEQMNYYGANKIPFLFLIDFEMNKPLAIQVNKINSKILLYDLEGYRNYSLQAPFCKPVNFGLKQPVPRGRYQKAFEFCLSRLNLGNSYLLNLTFPSEIETNLSLQDIFSLSSSKYKLWYKDKFVCFSPETFIKISKGKIFSYPMKGTIDSSIADAANILLNDEKEIAEHYTIVDLLRNDLSMVAQNVRVECFRYIEHITTHQKNLLQVSSRISGTLPSDYISRIGDILRTILPAGSVSGAPKKKTLEIIQQAEQYSRGYYTGVFGFFDGIDLNSAVLIRFIERIDGKLFYKSGGGITTRSLLDKEYEELLNKIYLSV